MIKTGIVGQGLAAARAVAGNVKAYMFGVTERGCDIDNSGKTPTGNQRLMYAIMLTKEVYHTTTKGKRVPKTPTKAERTKIINHMLRVNA